MIAGALRIRNEARWIADVIRSIQPLCDEIHVLDDQSTDGTPEICEKLGAKVTRSAFEGLDEARDKDHLLSLIAPLNPDVILCPDGDEILTPQSLPIIRDAIKNPRISHWSFRILYLWDQPNQIRTDGVYRDFRRSSMYRFKGQRDLAFRRTSHGGNFHCKSIPAGLRGPGQAIDAKLLHMGYLHRADRIRKWEWYRENDPNAAAEGGYMHCVQGDIPEVPASARLKWAGPLELQPLYL